MAVYAIENHPADSRVTIDTDGIVQTLSARCGTGGGNVPLVLMEKDMKQVCYAVDSHPGDSRIGIAGDISPTITVKIAKASADDPLVLVEKEKNDRFYVEAIGHDIRSTQFAKGGCCDTLMSNDYKYPCIVAYETRSADESISNDHRSVMRKQPSRQLYGTGCVQQHAPSDREEQP